MSFDTVDVTSYIYTLVQNKSQCHLRVQNKEQLLNFTMMLQAHIYLLKLPLLFWEINIT